MSLRPSMSVPADTPGRTARARTVRSPWAWMAITCLLLGVSGGIRYWRDRTFSALAVESANCPFPLSELPRTMGTWEATDTEVQLDPEVARFAGASDHILRNYVDHRSGEQASALALYGQAVMVSLHVPEICYPAAGYLPYKKPIDFSVEVPGLKEPVRYRWAIYQRRVGRVTRYEEVYYTFLHDGRWLPDAADHWKTFRYHPGLYKIQFAHNLSALKEGPDESSLSLLTEFVRQIQRRLPADGPAGPATAVEAAGR